MDAKNSSDQPVNETSSDKESIDDDQIVAASSSDNQSVDDATNDDYMKGEEMSSDGNSEEVSYVRYPL
jgi:hypothetical protein